MASTYSTSLRIQLIGTGDQAGTWGTTTNNNLGTLIEQAITGYQVVDVTGKSAYSLTSFNGIPDQARNAILEFTGSLSSNCTVTAPAVQKTYFIKNSTTGGYSIIITTGTGSTVAIPAGQVFNVYSDGTNYYLSTNYDGTNVNITGGTINGTTIGATTAASGKFTTLQTTGALTYGGVTLDNSVSGTGSMVLNTSPVIYSPLFYSETYSTNNAVTAAGTTQGTATAILSDYNVVTTTPSGSGIVLPAAIIGRRIIVVNKGANDLKIYPNTGAIIDALAANAAITLPVNGWMEFNASSATQWYSTFNVTNSGVSSFSAGSTGLTPSTSTTGAVTLGGKLDVLYGGTGVTTSTGTGSVVLSTSPSLTTPLLGTPTSGTLSNCTGLPISTGVSGLGSGIATFLATPSSANLASAVTDETGSGSLVFGTNPSLTTPALSGETFSTAATVTAGTNAQSQGAITNDYNVITTAAANPSGVTLPTATIGRRIVIVNKGANSVNIYPAAGGTIDALGINASIALPSGGVMTFNASSTTQWYSSYNLYTSATAAAGVTSFSGGSTGLTPSTATTGAVTLAGTLDADNGGTGQFSYAVGDILYASASNALSKLADVATGSALISGGVGVAPSYGKIGLTTHVSGTLPTANGGTGLGGATPFTNNGAVYASSASTLTTGTLPVASGGTGQSSTLTSGGVVYGASTTAMATTSAGTSGKTLISGGAGVAPSFGTLSVGGGGTGVATLTANAVLIGNGTSALTSVSPGTNGNVLTSNGTTWVSSAPAFTWNVSAPTSGYNNVTINTTASVFTIPTNTVLVMGTAYHYMGGNVGSCLAVTIKNSSGTSLGTYKLTGGNENDGADGGSALSTRSSWTVAIPATAAGGTLEFYRISGSGDIVYSINQLIKSA